MRSILSAVLAIVVILSPLVVYAINWTITDLGTLGGTQSFGIAINDPGQVIGYSWMAGDTSGHTFLYSKGEMTDLYPLNSRDVITNTMGINNAGQIASGLMVDGIYTAAIYDSKIGVTTPLGTLGGVTSYGFNGVATSINNVGQAVGYSYIDNINRHAFMYSNGAMTDLGSFGGYSAAMAVNDYGVAVGFASDVYNGRASATLWSNGTITNISPFGSNESYARGINNSGQVVGSFYDGSSAHHAFLYSDGDFVDLGSMGGPDATAYAINDRGQVVGIALVQVGTETGRYWDDELGWVTYTNPIYDYHGFLCDNGYMVDLNSLIPSDSGWNLQWAFDINNSDQIVGYGLLNDKFHAYVLTPHNVPEPSTILLLGAGLAGVGFLRRKFKK
jgi:probable HAF family extracellular repeat protein